MGEIAIELWLPVHPAIFGLFLAIAIAYIAYAIAKFVISIWTGA